ncbi:paraquat-inducible protein A [uncultured Roseibium sp.]|uniref:paraquat-inducible protein A n=1 Tax=uncultured Roseibium sp. TaxID=1936171 RepID=UPI00263968C7|nr:paraquat-inducible protein A [uncultured Roseibium sp.]
MRTFLALLLPLSAFSFALGLTQPLMRFEKLYFLEERPNLIEMITELWRQGDVALAAIVGLFSIGFPGVKILLIHIAAMTGGNSRSLALLSTVSKWSMLDVMLVALVLFAAKTSGLAAAAILPGLWFYAAATITTAAAASLCRRA